MFFYKSKQLEDISETKSQSQNNDASSAEREVISHDFISGSDFVQSNGVTSREQKGTITIKVTVSGKEFTRFTILPDLLSDAAGVVKGLIYAIEKPQIEITSNCECAWCNKKIYELEEFLKK